MKKTETKQKQKITVWGVFKFIGTLIKFLLFGIVLTAIGVGVNALLAAMNNSPFNDGGLLDSLGQSIGSIFK